MSMSFERDAVDKPQKERTKSQHRKAAKRSARRLLSGDSPERLPDIRPRYLAAREEIYGAHLAMNANAPLPRLTVPRDRRCIFAERHSKRREATLTIGRRFPPRTFQYGNQFRRVAPRDSSLVNRHRCTNARQYIRPSSHFSPFFPSICLVSFEPTLFDARQISFVFTDFVLYAIFQFQQWYLQNGEPIRLTYMFLANKKLSIRAVSFHYI